MDTRRAITGPESLRIKRMAYLRSLWFFIPALICIGGGIFLILKHNSWEEKAVGYLAFGGALLLIIFGIISIIHTKSELKKSPGGVRGLKIDSNIKIDIILFVFITPAIITVIIGLVLLFKHNTSNTEKWIAYGLFGLAFIIIILMVVWIIHKLKKKTKVKIEEDVTRGTNSILEGTPRVSEFRDLGYDPEIIDNIGNKLYNFYNNPNTAERLSDEEYEYMMTHTKELPPDYISRYNVIMEEEIRNKIREKKFLNYHEMKIVQLNPTRFNAQQKEFATLSRGSFNLNDILRKVRYDEELSPTEMLYYEAEQYN